ncbi:MAG: DUF1059 domain-containing protein [Candidatus Marsarchaeota archaeon]|jgi:Protein of unknown function (DUF1059).|nr:DUF1059 domain-containing protein [Candidatus Marsarchaeota archaeon]
MSEGRYRFAAKEAGSECQFEAAAEEREQLVEQIKEHGRSCQHCANLKEADIEAAIREG